MDDDERLYLEALLAEHRKRLRVLEIKKAQRGIDTPPDTLVEIGDIGKKIDRLTAQMHRAQAVVIDLFGALPGGLAVLLATIESSAIDGAFVYT